MSPEDRSRESLAARFHSEVAQVRQSLFEDRLFLGSVLERPPVRTFKGDCRRIVASRGERALRVGRGRLPGDRSTLDVGRNRQAKQVQDRGRGVDQPGLERAARGEPRAGEGDDAFGAVGAGEVRVGLTQEPLPVSWVRTQ